jgi:excisionase family DNA binding protein
MNDTVDMDEFLRAFVDADAQRRQGALRVLHGAAVVRSEERGPLLMGMGAAASFLGVSRPTLWRMIQAGRLQKVELFPGSFRIRKADLEELVAPRTNSQQTSN